MARARIHHWDADGDEGDVVGGGVAAVDGGVFVVVVVVRLVLDDRHGSIASTLYIPGNYNLNNISIRISNY